ncbi:NAD(P)H-hydrate dehydratase [Massilia sp. RP-1-19]|uniref:ADP-dependent (S)-NAD(P)H-hydrate dehydratase n=1 Tax=Massilia polaris TaxID=2728846 RepID=A0A848HU46_9BURK|nr:NAD(P)H-hydrate dehydratase [Massilia polaris]NML62198.1 NAD(P)H-hydrate dehydratase [Massilia polaris]
MKQATPASPTTVDDAFLRAWALPATPSDGDKEARGHVLILGGSAEMPGAVILAATAALRAGAGKLTIATGASVAKLVALAIPEARVIGLRENKDGGFTRDATAELNPLADRVNAVLIGPGMQDEASTAALVRALLPRLDGTSVVLDACAMGIILNPDLAPQQRPFRFELPVVVTPHAGEIAHLTGTPKQEILAQPEMHAARAAEQWNAVVALKGARTLIASPARSIWQHEGGNIGLAISGSGDTLAGIIAGLAARGATLEQAACWGVALHARAGDKLAERLGTLGYLARELPDEIPALMESIARG